MRLPPLTTMLIASIMLIIAPHTVWAISPDLVNDFEDGTTMGWGGNQQGTIQNIATGGSASDRYLETSIEEFHLGTKNDDAWSGDYLAAGVTAIRMDLNHLQPVNEDLRIRIVIFGPGGTFATVNRTPTLLQSQWSTHIFGLAVNDMIHVEGGTGILDDTLRDVTTLLIHCCPVKN